MDFSLMQPCRQYSRLLAAGYAPTIFKMQGLLASLLSAAFHLVHLKNSWGPIAA